MYLREWKLFSYQVESFFTTFKRRYLRRQKISKVGVFTKFDGKIAGKFWGATYKFKKALRVSSNHIKDLCYFAAYIVSYYGYYRADVRKEYIDESLQQIVVNIEKRPLLFSDFDVIEVSREKFLAFLKMF